ncbi:bifunctional [glutamate--ammonia ligase]-adenylyl-L-tyrosine phosphorylase/[glutamate--ammonia-ligase] adenylyltransferase [Variovorax terrae]|uniref:Bifunctional glutamine synthetase adenylyltransferase/adenylyl-removing enzyme n=1 Tax=Variovorax terrae TaxID=2923278 RepID=A0A9X2APZ0_9BURK|nr:bifunctional [glutamate--ammonia ligase]-adenylyl-L-tyrosine phosphorylase/[glutamate--ammonia-ligase] adenylyltransferase [Variovorax terrae]MCJ0765829.1 bifunctional [glutamate--ammonia ligase]-adenylyl-L-tyrosine phosphorylase/[glutamate--ammonia-ligase] adenylyltransferase [Variovorax terrae]
MTRSGPEGFEQNSEVLLNGAALATSDPASPAPADQPLSSHSRFAQRLRRRYGAQLPLLPEGAPVRATLEQAFQALRRDVADAGTALRILRQLVMERLIHLDCDAQASLQVVTRAVTELAEFALDVACTQAWQELDAQHGAPRTPEGERAQLWVVGMGKLGARELNVSSDIDLIYVYDHGGDTAGTADGRGRISNHEYFAKAVRIIYGLIGDTTEHGFVFRVDLALRPHGNSGPPAVSLGALEEYFQVQGREWERFAWLKSRVVAPLACVAGSAQALRGAVLPFVFRRYLDYNVFDALRTLHRQIREHASRRSAGRPERANDVKLSRGGIREIEFIVQLLQVVRGGQFPELRTRPTLDALQRLARAGLMPQDTAQALARAYEFLRRVEHRIQYLDDQQTHVLPTQDDDLAWIAQAMGYADCCAFLHELDAHREFVAQEFDTLLGNGTPATDPDCKKSCGCNGPKGGRAAAPELDDLLEQLPGQFRDRVLLWREHPRVRALREDARARLARLVQRTAQWLREGKVSEDAAVRLADWIEPLLRRESYLALLLERPSVHLRLLRLLGAARWPARYLLLHPGVIDELASDAMLSERFVAADFERELEQRRGALKSTGEDDDETLLNLLRRAHHAEVFRTLSRDVEGRLSVEQVADDLSALADAVLRVTARWCWQRLKSKHHDEPRFAIIGYGKLGGKELGYGSDLDIVFVYEDEDERAPEVYAAFVRKLINWLTVKTAEGDLFEIDTALRPNGNSGLLITTFQAYANYQQQRGSNTAWTWEHQAMTRARFVLGGAEAPAPGAGQSLRERFDAVRRAVITAPRDVAALRGEIVAMRDKVRAARPVKDDRFDVKHSPGGMVDAEFAVQFLVLSQSARHPELIDNVGNIALLLRSEEQGLLPAGVGQAAASAYRELRRVQHQARLNEEPTQVEPPALQAEREAVLALWAAVFG